MYFAEMGKCPNCKGAKAVYENVLVPCDFVNPTNKAPCQGGHFIMSVRQVGLFQDKTMDFKALCEKCKGEGQKVEPIKRVCP
jgi:DnaJ-class molecular chaperone